MKTITISSIDAVEEIAAEKIKIYENPSLGADPNNNYESLLGEYGV